MAIKPVHQLPTEALDAMRVRLVLPSETVAAMALPKPEPEPEPEPKPEPKPKPKPKPKRRATKSSDIKPLPNPAAEVTAAIGQINKSVNLIAPGVAAALASLERRIDTVANPSVIIDVRAEVASVKDYIQSLRGGYVMEVVRGEDDKIIRVDIDPK